MADRNTPSQWDIAERALVANGAAPEGPDVLVFRMAGAGHVNAVPILEALIADLTGCSCGDDNICGGESETAERVTARESIRALLATLKHS